VYRLASEYVKVMVSGNGGDELLAGYIPYFRGTSRRRSTSATSSPVASW
jgi:asparagine synthetase B (glutamine-hydrolysing)